MDIGNKIQKIRADSCVKADGLKLGKQQELS